QIPRLRRSRARIPARNRASPVRRILVDHHRQFPRHQPQGFSDPRVTPLYKATGGTLAACEQFGAAVCNHNVQSLQSTGGCGSYTDGAGHTGGQTVCSWGQHADQQAANQNCTLNGSKSNGGTSCPTNNTTPGTIISPSPGNAPVSLPPNLA